MKRLTRNCLFFSNLGSILGLLSLTLRADQVRISIDCANPGVSISRNMLGLSYETSLMLPDSSGVHYFRPDNQPLINIFKTTGVKSLRIGGNSVDAPKVPIPTESDIRSFFEFARAAGVKVIYSVRLEESTNSGALPPSNAESAGKIAKLIHDHYSNVLDCFAIGNEPDYFRGQNYAVYPSKWKAIRDAILAVYPQATFAGPDQNPSPVLSRQMVHEFGDGSGRLVMVTQHTYPFGCSYKNPNERSDVGKLIPFDAAASREKMLSPAAYRTYQNIYKGIADAISGTSISYRLTECNSFWFSGLKGASDSYASALWAVDFLNWWALHGADGLNFHTGDRTGGDLSMDCRYAAFVTSRQGYEARPLAYGMKLFDLAGHGKRLNTAVGSATNFIAYACLDNDSVSVTLLNTSHGPEAKDRAVEIDVDVPLLSSNAEILFLRSRNDDVSGGPADVTLGGAPIKEDGSWNGQWTQLPSAAATGNRLTLTMPPASAAVVKFSVHHSLRNSPASSRVE